MARVSREQSQKHREQILDAASGAFRERGFDGVSVADLMAEAGLTHGGFYGHFPSKDALEAQACARAFERTSQRWAKTSAANPGAVRTRREVIERYLSPGHRERPGLGCPAAALAADIARKPDAAPARAAFAAGVRRRADDLLPYVAVTGTKKTRRKLALTELSTLVGAILLARATKGDPISDEILAAVRGSLLEKR